MERVVEQSAEALRRSFYAIGRADRDANQPFSIRIWRGLSWLERAEAAEDMEGRFISLWIAFNAVYGQLQPDGLHAPDHATWQEFLARLVRADGTDRIGRLLWDQQVDVLRLIENQFLFRPFWLGQDDAAEKVRRCRQRAMRDFRNHNVLGVLEELFERLYVLRQQVFHGAATSGSKLNRRTLKLGTTALGGLMPAIIDIMIEAGPATDWGDVCFPPVDPS